MQELAQKLGDYTLFSGRESQAHPGGHNRFQSFGSGMGEMHPNNPMNPINQPGGVMMFQQDGRLAGGAGMEMN